LGAPRNFKFEAFEITKAEFCNFRVTKKLEFLGVLYCKFIKESILFSIADYFCLITFFLQSTFLHLQTLLIPRGLISVGFSPFRKGR